LIVMISEPKSKIKIKYRLLKVDNKVLTMFAHYIHASCSEKSLIYTQTVD